MTLPLSTLTEQEQRCWEVYRQATRLLQDHLERRLQHDARMRPVHYDVLSLLAQAPDARLRMNELARGAHVSASRISQTVNRLEAAGWVRREDSAEDRRGQVAVLTEAGGRVLGQAAPVLSEAVHQALLGPLSSAQRNVLTEIMTLLAEGLRRSGP
ncbi:MarR family winged helix-turn-helix transcriptional regulator [Streptomyces sp. NPDC088785]|uniref:MarR family winged helix-turn-helix transcriptional regulator n=1 Tax=Streptomyces sp. NPDC088785 TaxID=3365897 RepID=UPI0037FCAC44